MSFDAPSRRTPDDVLSEHSASWLLRRARFTLTGETPAGPLGPPPASVKTPNDATVFLTRYAGGTTASYRGQGANLLAALDLAADAAAIATPGSTPDRLQLDIVLGMAQPLPRPEVGEPFHDPVADASWKRLTSFQDGIVVGHQNVAYWLVASQLLLQGMARRNRDVRPPHPPDILAAAMRGIGWPEDAWRDPTVDIWSFQSATWIEDAAQTRPLRLVQGIVAPGAIPHREQLLASAVAAGEYLLRAQQVDGSFQYTVDPWLRVQSRDAYNILRHAGTTACLFELHAATGDARFLTAASRGVQYLTHWFRPGAEDGLSYVLDYDGKGKLGALGLALLALTRKLEAAPSVADRERASALARQIVKLQHPDGSFESYLRIRGDEPHGSVSLYYPGEAMLGLARLARLSLDPDGHFQAAAHRGAAYLIESRAGRERLPPDAWLMQALEVLFYDRPDVRYVEHALAIARSMLADQYGEDSPPAYASGFGPEPIRSTRTTARVEGLVAAYRLACKANDDRARELVTPMLRTAPHLLALQYTPDTSYFLARPERALGGMRGGLDDAEIRIDYVQHHVSAMLGLAALLDAEKTLTPALSQRERAGVRPSSEGLNARRGRPPDPFSAPR